MSNELAQPSADSRFRGATASVVGMERASAVAIDDAEAVQQAQDSTDARGRCGRRHGEQVSPVHGAAVTITVRISTTIHVKHPTQGKQLPLQHTSTTATLAGTARESHRAPMLPTQCPQQCDVPSCGR